MMETEKLEILYSGTLEESSVDTNILTEDIILANNNLQEALAAYMRALIKTLHFTKGINVYIHLTSQPGSLIQSMLTINADFNLKDAKGFLLDDRTDSIGDSK